MRRALAVGVLALLVGCKKSPTEPECLINGVSLSQTALTMTVGQTVDIQATIAQSGCAGQLPGITFSSANPAIVAVSGLGTITAVAVGATTVTAQIQGRNESASAQITVNGRVLSFSLSPDSTAVPVAGTVQLAANLSVDPGTPTAIEWTSADPTKATVNGSGLVTGVAAGTVVITAKPTADPSKALTAKVTVTPRVSGITVSPTRDTLTVTGTVTLDATVSGDPGVATSVIWRSSDPAVATVVAGGASALGAASLVAGTVTGVGAGTAEITAIATADTTKRATATVVILARVLAISVAPSTAAILVGGATQLTATVTGDPGLTTAVTWGSQQPGVATVSATGVVTGVAPGVATIVATSTADPSKTASGQITVSAGVPLTNLCLALELPGGGGGGESPPPSSAASFLVSPQCPAEVRLDLAAEDVYQLASYLASAPSFDPVATTWTESNPTVLDLLQTAPGEFELIGDVPGQSTLEFRQASAPSVTARVDVRVVAVPSVVVCPALTLGGACVTSVTVGVGQSVTLYSRNSGNQPTPAIWALLSGNARIPNPAFFDTRVTLTGVSPGGGLLQLRYTAGGPPAALTVTVVP